MTGNLNPTAAQLIAAIRDHGVPLRLMKGYNTRGREWASEGSPGLMACVNHHTSTPSATGSTGAPTLEWVTTATSRGACNLLVGRGRDDVWLITAGSAFHSGKGGPFPAIGITEAGNEGHRRMFGIEIDDPGVEIGSMTDTQVEMVGRVNAALMDLCGWGTDRIITHQSWTDGLDGVNPGGDSPYKGRKNDTLRGDGIGPYSATFWRQNARKYVASTPKPPPVPPTPPAPKPIVSVSKVRPGMSNPQVLIVQKALAKENGLDYSTGPGVFGPRTQASYSRWQQSLGYTGTAADGAPGIKSLTTLGDKYGFRVVL